MAYPVAYVLSTASPRWVLIGLVFLMLPFWTSILVRTYAWMILLGRNGVLNQALLGAGMIVGGVLLTGGLGWAAVTILSAFEGAPDGPLWGWGPLISALIIIAAGAGILFV